MAKLTKNQAGLIDIYADQISHYKKYWVIWCIGGARKVCGEAEAKKNMIYWAHEAVETAKVLGFKRDQIHAEILWCVDNYEYPAELGAV